MTSAVPQSRPSDVPSWSAHFVSFKCPSQIWGQMWLSSLKRPYRSPLSSKTILWPINESIVGRRSTGTLRSQGEKSEGSEGRIHSALPDPAGRSDFRHSREVLPAETLQKGLLVGHNKKALRQRKRECGMTHLTSGPPLCTVCNRSP